MLGIYAWLGVILLLAFALAGYDVYEEMESKQKERLKESESCLKMYEDIKCSAIEPSPKCVQLIECIRKDERELEVAEVFNKSLGRIKSTCEGIVLPLFIVVGVMGFMFLKSYLEKEHQKEKIL